MLSLFSLDKDIVPVCDSLWRPICRTDDKWRKKNFLFLFPKNHRLQPIHVIFEFQLVYELYEKKYIWALCVRNAPSTNEQYGMNNAEQLIGVNFVLFWINNRTLRSGFIGTQTHTMARTTHARQSARAYGQWHEHGRGLKRNTHGEVVFVVLSCVQAALCIIAGSIYTTPTYARVPRCVSVQQRGFHMHCDCALEWHRGRHIHTDTTYMHARQNACNAIEFCSCIRLYTAKLVFLHCVNWLLLLFWSGSMIVQRWRAVFFFSFLLFSSSDRTKESIALGEWFEGIVFFWYSIRSYKKVIFKCIGATMNIVCCLAIDCVHDEWSTKR